MGWLSRVPGAARAREAVRLGGQAAAVQRSAGAHEPRPPATGLVLEVGAGQSPQPRTDVVVEKYLFDDHERPGEATFSFRRPVVVGDGESLPFADGTFAYSICLHVLEHAVEPARFAGELSRVSAAGFVQVPSRLAELTFGWDYHPWLIDKDAGRLVFEPKGGRSAPCGQTFHELFGSDELTRLWFNAHRARWHHSVEWAGTLDVATTGSSAAASTADADVDATVRGLTALGAAGQRLPLLPPAARAALRCPRCRGELADATDALRCTGCAAEYPAPAGVPVLLVEAAR